MVPATWATGSLPGPVLSAPRETGAPGAGQATDLPGIGRVWPGHVSRPCSHAASVGVMRIDVPKQDGVGHIYTSNDGGVGVVLG